MLRVSARAVAIGTLVALVRVCPASDVVWIPIPLLAYPTPIANNAVTSVDDGSGWATVVYSFMGIRDPGDEETITAASYKLEYPQRDPAWERIADAPLGAISSRMKPSSRLGNDCSQRCEVRADGSPVADASSPRWRKPWGA